MSVKDFFICVVAVMFGNLIADLIKIFTNNLPYRLGLQLGEFISNFFK